MISPRPRSRASDVVAEPVATGQETAVATAGAREALLVFPPGAEAGEIAAAFAARGFVVRSTDRLPAVEEVHPAPPALLVVESTLLPRAPGAAAAWSTGRRHSLLVVLEDAAEPAETGPAARRLERPISSRALVEYCELALRDHDAERRASILLGANQDLRTVLDVSDQLYLLLDEAARIKLANRAAYVIVSEFCQKPLVLGERAFSLLGPELRRLVRPHFAAAAGGETVRAEVMVRDLAGRPRFISVTYGPVIDADGAVRHVCFRARDISQRRQAEENLRASQSRLQALFDHSHDAILLADDAGAYVDANPAACALLGYQRRELLTLGVADVFASSDRTWARQAWNEFLERGDQHGECRLLRKDGAIVRADYSAIARIQPGLHLSILRDLTEKHTLQSQLLRQHRLESVGRLASGVAHDLNNILTPILMAPAMLRPHIGDAGARMLLESVENAARRGSTVVRQLLAFSRSEPGAKVRLDLQKVVRDACAMLQESLPKSVTLEFARSAGEFPVLGDATQLQQVVVNLALNGVDAMPRGGRLVFGVESVAIPPEEARRDPEVSAGRHVVVTIADHGHGIAPENLDKVFDPFFTTKPFGQGSGMGLSVVLGIVRGHGGFARVSSRLGVGTLVKIFLPWRDDAASPDDSMPPLRPAASARGSGHSVLVVDDESDVRDIVRMILAREGYRVTCADGADAAFSQLKANGGRVDLVITDLAMPGVSGAQFIQRLRKQRREVPVLVMTGTDLVQFLPDSVRELTQGVLSKPFDSKTLLALVREAIASGV
jgi:two-component system, cell cycle sensor histidine kinase and response regulator CckA